ncbi:uncharacterized protein F4807DRAFT_284155 [Annulohypoxylon truncatum]|uniref:uncharacterized protein n=1 Tax=Annulohypoxylon truncatum TaxID=327061 RepID=UPI0020086B59|nr:uncharacterized protein F4807DRAFT_284155 [Annulohypoxylon truncatum]KAI1205395.1 hypothetical protein F4807DRAFT_284155 [Annulohypoxylon truncatum]
MLRPLLIEIATLFLGGCMVLQVLATTCYHLDGTNAGPSNALCNPNATGTEGSHSSCCNAENGDACLSTGLCFNTLSRQQSHLLWATACTDPTFKDPSCPQYCQGLKIDNAHLKACNDSGFWCCESDANILTPQQCCDSSFKLTQPVGTVIAQLQSGVGAIPLATASSLISNSTNGNPSTDTSDSVPSGVVAGLAIEGVIMVFALAGTGFMFWRNRLLKKKVLEAEAATIAAKSQQQQQQQSQYQWQPPPLSHGTMHHSGAWGYNSPVETEPKRSELQTPGLGTYTELPGVEVIGTELSSEPRTPKTPGSPSHQQH